MMWSVKEDERRLVAALERKDQMFDETTQEKSNLDEVWFVC